MKRSRDIREEDEYELLEELDILNVSKKDKKAFYEVKNYMEESEPSLGKVLDPNLSFESKSNLLQLYGIYSNTDRYTVEKYELRKKLVSLLSMEKEMKDNIDSLVTTESNKAIISIQNSRALGMSADNDESSKLKEWVRNALALPFDRTLHISLDLSSIKNNLDRNLFGMTKAKEKILIYLSARMKNPNMKKNVLGLIGNPGVGKTMLVNLLAKSSGIPFEQISFGGLKDGAFLTGHEYVYIGSRPGEISNSLVRMGCKNGIIFLDEFEKVYDNCASTLLHILDSSTNNRFKDKYFNGLEYDLSQVWFILSMNSKPTDKALDDRIYYIEIDDYTIEEKKCILRDYLLPKALENIGLKHGSIVLNNGAIDLLVEKIDNVRGLNDTISFIVNKIDYLGKKYPFTVTKALVETLRN